MTDPQFDVIGIGNAIVDVLAHADDEFLAAEGLTKGTMTLIDAEEAKRLYQKIGPAVESSGGSAANTIAGLASLGGQGAFIGKVHDDQLGEVFRHDIRALGVAFDTVANDSGPPTATSMILVTPDAQRTMQTLSWRLRLFRPGRHRPGNDHQCQNHLPGRLPLGPARR